MTLNDLGILTRNSFRDPGLALRQLQSLDLPMQARWMALLVVVALSAILGSLAAKIFPALAEGSLGIPVLSPMARVILQTGGMVLTAWLIATVGRAFGGRGDFPDALLIVVWLQLILLGFQALQLVVAPIAPAFAGLIGLASFGIFLWLMTTFIAELHGFTSRGMVFLGMTLTALAAGFLLGMLMILFLGPEALLPNV